MKTIILYKKVTVLGSLILLMTASTLLLNSCAVSKKISQRSGVQLWAENCQRCHNTPSPATFSPEKWETVGLHMQSRALLTESEREKIVAFLKQQ